jgi:hypothetical protein
MKKNKIAIIFILTTLLVTSSVQSASAARVLPCSSTTYACTLNGYSGMDNYLYYLSGPIVNGGRHNCTSYAAYMISLTKMDHPHYGDLGNAIDWDTNAVEYGFPVGQVPHDGDVAQFDSNDGHVAWVESVVYSTNGSVSYIVTSDDNVSGYTTAKKRFPGTVSWPDLFITFPPLPGGGGPRMGFQSAPLGTK